VKPRRGGRQDEACGRGGVAPPALRRAVAGRAVSSAVTLLLGKAPALAAVLLAASAASAASQVPGSGGLLRRPARLEVRGAELGAALAELGRSSGVRIAWSRDLVAQAGPVSCACARATLAQALDTLLAGTDLVYAETQERVAVMPRPGGPGAERPRADSREAVVTAHGTLVVEVLTGPDSRAVAGAEVQVDGGAGRARTDSSGRCSLRLRAGTYDLTVRALSHSPRRVRGVQVRTGEGVTVSVHLEPLIVTLSEVTVTPSRFSAYSELPVSTAALTREEIGAIPHLGEDVFRSISDFPGLATHDLTAQFTVRGGSNDEVLSRLDGVELVEPFHIKDFEGGLSILDVGAIGSLDLVTGGFTSEFGRRMTGLVDMRSVDPAAPGRRNTVGLSITALRASSRGGFANGRGGWFLSARRGFLQVVGDLTGIRNWPDPTYYDSFAKIQYRLGYRHLVALHWLLSLDQLKYRENSDPTLTSRYAAAQVWAAWSATVGSALTGSTVLSFGRMTSRRSCEGSFPSRYGAPDPCELWDVRASRAADLRTDWTYALGERLALKAGGELRAVSADYSYLGRRVEYSYLNDAVVREVTTTRVAIAPAGWAAGWHLAARLRPLTPLVAELGVRWDRIGYTGDRTLDPRLNASWALGARTAVRAAWGHYHQAEGIHQVAVQDGEEGFFPAERAEQRVVGFEHGLASGVSARVEAYDRLYRRTRPRYLNLGNDLGPFPDLRGDRFRIDPTRGRARGVEVLLERRLGGRLDWSASYALAEAWDDVGGRRVPRVRDQRHTISLSGTWSPGSSWRVGAAWHFHTGWPLTEPDFGVYRHPSGYWVIVPGYGPLNGGRLPDYHRVDLRVSRRWHVGAGLMQVFLDVFNVFNAVNPRTYVYGVWVVEGRVIRDRSPEDILPILPSVGVTWEW